MYSGTELVLYFMFLLLAKVQTCQIKRILFTQGKFSSTGNYVVWRG